MTDLKGKRIVVTGGAGFLGRRVVAELLKSGEPIEVLVPRRVEYDLTHERSAAAMFRDLKPQIVVHLAAEVGGIGANRAQPGRFCYANLAMGLNVVEQCRAFEVEKLLVVGTVCAYPMHCPTPFNEADLWAGYPEPTNAPYGVAKRAILTLTQAYRQQYGLNGVYLLPANLYGPGDNFDLQTSHVIAALIRKFGWSQMAGVPRVTLWGTGAATREFLYVDDAARAIVLALRQYEHGEPLNIGTGSSISIKALAELIGQLMGWQGEIKWDRDRPDGQPRRQLDVTRARTLLGWRAATPLEDGLGKTIAWWRQQQAAKA